VTTALRVLVADDNPDVRAMLETRLRHAGHEVLLARDGTEALTLAGRQPIDVALVDVRMPGPGGATLARHLKERCPTVEVIVITAYGSMETAVDAMRDGVFYYLAKPLDMTRVLELVAEAGAAARRDTSLPTEESLSPRERQVLDALSDGQTDAEIADRLGISVHTVHAHVRNVLAKLRARNRVQAALLWDRLSRHVRRRSSHKPPRNS